MYSHTSYWSSQRIKVQLANITQSNQINKLWLLVSFMRLVSIVDEPIQTKTLMDRQCIQKIIHNYFSDFLLV